MSIERLEQVWPEWKNETLLGEGSFGKVYKAVRTEHGLTTYSAIKVVSIPQSSAELNALRSEGMSDNAATSYFEGAVSDIVNEIKLMESMKGSPNIVHVEDYRVLEKSDAVGWDIFIRMELLTSFNEYVGARKLSEAEVIKIGLDILAALELCGQKNIIHRDIKPENIFVSPFGHFKLGDFGIAREREKAAGDMSQKGTYNYMAPEVLNSRHYDATVDTYSLGIVLYKLLNNNRLPFLDPYAEQIGYQERKDAIDRRMAGETLPAPSEASDSMAQILLKACAVHPHDRFALPRHFINTLEALQHGLSLSKFVPSASLAGDTPSASPALSVPSGADDTFDGTVAVRRAGHAVAAVPSPQPQAAVQTFGHEKKKKKKKKSKAPAVIIVIALLALLGTAAYYFLAESPIDRIINTLDSLDYDAALSIYNEGDVDAAVMEAALMKRIDKIKAEFAAREIDYNTAKMEMSTMARFRLGSLTEAINDANLFLEDMNDSHVAFDYAEALFAEGDYPGAMKQYGLVIEEDPDFEKAKTGHAKAVTEYKNATLAEAQSLADEKAYQTAVALIDAALADIGNDPDLTQQRDSYIQLDVDDRVAAALGLADDGEYEKAIGDLRSLHTAYPDDSQVSRALSDTEARHISTVLAEANAFTRNGNYDVAQQVLAEVMRLHPGNPDIQDAAKSNYMIHASSLAEGHKYDEAIELLNKSGYANEGDVRAMIADYTARRPAALGVVIMPYQMEKVVMFSRESPVEMMGAVYENGLRTDYNSYRDGMARAYINTDGNYKYMSALYGPTDNPTVATANVTLTIWGDGRILATHEMLFDDPIAALTINIEEINQLIIEFTHNASYYSPAGEYALANVVFSSEAEITSHYNEPIGLYTTSPVLGRDISAYRIVNGRPLSRAEPAMMMGVEYDNGLMGNDRYATWYLACYNIDGGYGELSGTYGPLDGIHASARVIINVYGDGVLLATYDVASGDTAKPFSVEVTDVIQVKFHIAANQDTRDPTNFVLADMILSTD